MTQAKALEKIFSQAGLSSTMRFCKHQFKKGKLTEEVQKKILVDNGYELKKDAVWTKDDKI